jgi:DNA polymerase III delta prime subunit
MNDNEDFLWVNKYRPTTVEDCILPDRIKAPFLNFVKDGAMPHLLLTGTAGTGKTTIARALCNDLGYESYLVNASKDRNLGVLQLLTTYASTVSLTGKRKVIILDEADGLSASNNSNAQAGLRALIEEFENVRFILTANFKNKLIAPIQSRCANVEFNITSDEKETMMLKVLKRVFEILKKENVKFDQKAVADIVKKYYPDNRKTLMVLQQYAAGGEIGANVSKLLQGSNIDSLVGFMRERDLGSCRKWVADNSDAELAQLYLDLYTRLYQELENDSKVDMILLVSEYQDKATRAINQEINTMAFIASIFALNFKKADA